LADEEESGEKDFRWDQDPSGFVSIRLEAGAHQLPVIKSVLEAAGIPHVVQGEHVFGSVPIGGVGRATRAIGPVILVPESRRQEAEALLATPPEPETNQD
jgi:hypothetical protein